MLNLWLWNLFFFKVIKTFIIFDIWSFFRFFKILKVIFLFLECIPVLLNIFLRRWRLLKLIESIIRSVLLPPSGPPLLTVFSWFGFLELFEASFFLFFLSLILNQIFLFYFYCVWQRLVIEVSEAIIIL
jgi:hypothetical protein